jgi:hypothetical protein
MWNKISTNLESVISGDTRHKHSLNFKKRFCRSTKTTTVCGLNKVMASQQDTHQLAAATAASVQALAAALQQQTFQPGAATRLSLPPFWPQEPAAWFQHVEGEFLLARVPLTSYLGYLHVIRALPPDVVTSRLSPLMHTTW